MILFKVLSVAIIIISVIEKSKCLYQHTCSSSACIPVRACRSISDALLMVKRPLSAKASQILNSYVCNNISHNEYRVCCPSEPVELDPSEMNTDMIENIRLTQDITLHKNYYLLPTDCGFVDLGTVKVINGYDAELTEYPWMALLSFRETDHRGHFLCGGTIINERYILTAAHCLENFAKLLGVRVGEYDISTSNDCLGNFCNQPIQDLIVEETIPHPDYQHIGYINDIGLLRVTPIRLNDNNIRPICLPRLRNEPTRSKVVEVSGWGITDAFASQMSNVKQKAYLPVVDNERCKEIYKNSTFTKIDERTICAGGGKDKSYPCKGDSGGPIQAQEEVYNIVRFVQRGIVSQGMRSCDSPGIFTKVSYYVEWILDNIKP